MVHDDVVGTAVAPHRPLVAAEFTGEIHPLCSAVGFLDPPREPRPRKDELEPAVVGGRPEQAAGGQDVDVVAVEIDDTRDDAKILRRLVGTEAVARDPQGLRRVVDEVAVPAWGHGEIDAERVADLPHPAGLEPRIVELPGEPRVHRPTHLVDERAAEAGCEQERRIDGRCRQADREARVECGEPEAVRAEPRELRGCEDHLLKRTRLRARRQLPAGRRLELLPGLAGRREIVGEERLGEILRVAERGQTHIAKRRQADPLEHALLHGRQGHDRVVGPHSEAADEQHRRRDDGVDASFRGGAPARGRQKSPLCGPSDCRVGRGGPRLLERSPTPSPPSSTCQGVTSPVNCRQFPRKI